MVLPAGKESSFRGAEMLLSGDELLLSFYLNVTYENP